MEQVGAAEMRPVPTSGMEGKRLQPIEDVVGAVMKNTAVGISHTACRRSEVKGGSHLVRLVRGRSVPNGPINVIGIEVPRLGKN